MAIQVPNYPKYDDNLITVEEWTDALVRQLRSRDQEQFNFFRTQTAFCARTDSTTTFNSGTATTIDFDHELFDLGTRYDGTNTFSAPVRGIYNFSVNLTFDNTAGSDKQWEIKIVTTDADFTHEFVTPSASNAFSLQYTTLALLDTEDTAKITIARVSGSGTVTLSGGLTENFFAGNLVEYA